MVNNFPEVAMAGKTVGDLEIFLMGLQLGEFISTFHDHKVEFSQLLSMTDADLQKMGVAKVGGCGSYCHIMWCTTYTAKELLLRILLVTIIYKFYVFLAAILKYDHLTVKSLPYLQVRLCVCVCVWGGGGGGEMAILEKWTLLINACTTSLKTTSFFPKSDLSAKLTLAQVTGGICEQNNLG